MEIISEAVLVLMALWWLYGGYVYPVVVKPVRQIGKVKFDLKSKSQLPPKTVRILTEVFCNSGPNLVIPAWTGDELWCLNKANLRDLKAATGL